MYLQASFGMSLVPWIWKTDISFSYFWVLLGWWSLHFLNAGCLTIWSKTFTGRVELSVSWCSKYMLQVGIKFPCLQWCDKWLTVYIYGFTFILYNNTTAKGGWQAHLFTPQPWEGGRAHLFTPQPWEGGRHTSLPHSHGRVAGHCTGRRLMPITTLMSTIFVPS